VNVVIPMAGRGSRFADIGIAIPKPMIDVRGKPMYAWAIDSLPLRDGARVIFVCQNEHLDRSGLHADITKRYARWDPEVIGIDGVTDGQACTVLVARTWIDSDEPLLIFNADTALDADHAAQIAALPASCAGGLGVFAADGDRWSFARTDASGRVVETAEKKRISDHASTGLYYFTRGRDFVRYADAMIADDDRTRGEFYVAPVYNRMIADGLDVRLLPTRRVWVLGTPDDLAAFDASYPRDAAPPRGW
jgi:dTDP-glucose pyrophosphorylase